MYINVSLPFDCFFGVEVHHAVCPHKPMPYLTKATPMSPPNEDSQLSPHRLVCLSPEEWLSEEARALRDEAGKAAHKRISLSEEAAQVGICVVGVCR